MDDESLLQFPCDFPIKAMGLAEPGFDALVIRLVRRHVPDLGEGAVTTRASRGGKWLSVTVWVRATSKEQLDNIYRDLTGHKQVVMCL